jgi:CubicO group peptidase (beta-lactamase class C family)
MIRSTAVLLLLLVNGFSGDSRTPAHPDSPRELVGLWYARDRFGPDIRGPLILQRNAGQWIGDVAGRRVKARRQGDTLSFELPNGEGGFRGHLSRDRSRIDGHWIQPVTVNTGARFSSPVTLQMQRSPSGFCPAAPLPRCLAWGEAHPLDDVFTFYLKIQQRPDGSTGAFLVNPERNLGRLIRVDRIELDGDTVRLLSRIQGNDSSQVVLTGTYRDSAITIAIPGRGGSYDFRRVPSDSETDFYPRGRPTMAYHYLPPAALADGWPTGTPAQVGISPDSLRRFIQMISDMPMDSLSVPQIHGVLIARHGRLVLEEYFHGAHRDQPHDLRSAAKSLTSVLIGAAIQSGVPLSPASRVYQVMNGGTFPAGLDSRKRALTLEHLITMSSGLDCDDSNDESPGNENTMQSQTGQPDWYRFILDLKNIRDPGQLSVYCSINPHLAGGVLARAAGRPLAELFHDLVAQPLGIRRYYLFLAPLGEAYMGGGVRLLPRDFMKLGQLMLNDGTWKGKRVLSRDWVRRSTDPKHEIGNSKYGYLWWITDYPYHGGMVRAYYASGNGGQYVIVVPELDLVVAFYGGNYADRPARIPQQEWMPKFVLPAVGGM